MQEGSTLRRGKNTAGDYWLLKLAVVKTASNHTPNMGPIMHLDVPRCHAEGCACSRMHGELRLAFCCGIAAGIAHKRSLANPRLV